VSLWQRSDQSGCDFAVQNGLNPNTFAWWRSELGREEPQRLSLVQVRVPTARPVGGPLEVVLPGRIIVRVPENADPESVAALVHALVAR
jgi:hypothetical protein